MKNKWDHIEDDMLASIFVEEFASIANGNGFMG